MGGVKVGKSMGALAAKGRVSLKELAAHTLRAESPEAEPREDGEDTGRVLLDHQCRAPCCCQWPPAMAPCCRLVMHAV